MTEEATFKSQLLKVKESYNSVDLVEEENIPLKPAGPAMYKGLCPFHSEKTPSFTVNENFQNYRCFGCGAHGDIFNFIQNRRGCSFKDAVLYLAEMQNIEIDMGGEYKKDDTPHVDLKALYTLLQDSYNFYRAEYEKLPITHPAKKEITDRGLDADNPVFCYAPERYGALLSYLTEKGYSETLMTQSELISKGENGKLYDFFHSRLMITLSDFSGRPVSYSARKLFDSDTRAKYVNGKQSPIFPKKSTLFNLDNAKSYIRDTKKAVVCEGPFDVLALEKAGVHNAVASCGTAFTEEQLRSIEQLVEVDGSIVFAFDGDEAGIQAAVKTFLHFPLVHGNGLVVQFPEGLDPCDYLVKYGAEALIKPLEKETPIIDFVLSALADKLKLSDMQSRYKFARLTTGRYVPTVSDKVLRNYMLRRISVLSGIQVDALTPMVGKTAKQFNHDNLKNDTTGDSEIAINLTNDTENAYITAFAMLVNRPALLFPIIRNINMPEMYKKFLAELRVNSSRYYQKKEPVRIIPEQYSQPNFVKYLQGFNVMIDYADDETLVKHFREVIKIALANYEIEQRQQRQVSINQALSGATSTEEIIKLLEVVKKQNEERDTDSKE